MKDLYKRDYFLQPKKEEGLYGKDFFLNGSGYGVPYTPPPEEDEGGFFQRLLGEAQDFFGAKKEGPEEGTFQPKGIEGGGTIPPAEVYPPQAQAATPAFPMAPTSAEPQAVPTTPLAFPGTPLNTLPQANPAPQESIAQMPPELVGERRGYKPGDIPKALAGGAEAVGSTIWNTGIGALGGVLGALSLPYGIDEAVKNMQGFQKDLGYSPHSEMGKVAEGVIQYPFEKLHEFALKQGDETLKHWGSPLYAAAVATAIDLMPLVVMKAPAEVTAPVIREMADVIKKSPEMTRGEMARKYRSVFEDELAKSRAASPTSEKPSPTLIKSTEGAKEVPKVKGLPAPKLVESIEEVRQALAQNFEDVYNADPVITAKREAGQLALRDEFAKGKEIPSGPPIAMAGPIMEAQTPQVPQEQEPQLTSAPTTMPDFQTTNEVMDWAKDSTPTVENIEETYKLENFYKNKYEQLRDSKDIDGAIQAATKKQMFREAREHLLGTGSARTEPVLEFPNVEELKSVGLGADARGFEKFSEANNLLEQLQLEALQEFGEPLDDLNVAKIGNEYHVIREEGAPEPEPLGLNEEVLDEIAPEEADEFTQAPPTKEEKATRAEARLEEIFSEIVKEQEERALEKAKAEKAKEILESEDKIESTKELGLPEPLEPMEKGERAYWEDILAAEGMKEELPLESDVNDREALDLGDDDYSRDLVDIFNNRLNSGLPVDLAAKAIKKALANRQPENPFTSVASKWDVEHPFKKMGWPELGLAMKNRFSIMETYEKEGIRMVQKLSDMRLGTKADYGRVSLYHENPGDMTPEARKHYGKAVKDVSSYLETWLQRFKDKGGLKRGFVENFKIRKKGHNYFLRQEIKKLKKARKPNEALIQEKWDKIKENNDIIKSMEGVHYTPLTTAWLDEMLEQRPVTLDKAFKIFAHTKRKVPTLKGLLELRDKNGRPVLTLEQIDIRDILARYARRSARDMAYLDIRNAALKDGAMTRKFKQGSGYIKVEANQLKAFKGLYAHRALQEYLLEMTMAWQKGGKLHNVFALTKMAQFINPSFLAVYDVIQGTMTGVLTSVHTPKNFFRAWKEVKNFKSEYVNASLNGLFSQPINNVTSSWNKQVKNAMHPLATRLRRKALSEGFWPIEHVYNAAHEGAWLGDRFVRMISYLNLRDRGYSPKDAAQLAAKIHGDYASVPIEIRQKANWFMFTPTFKVVMGKLYYEMGKAALGFAVKPHTIFMEKGPNGKWGRTRLTQKHTMAMGLAMFIGFNMARDYMMQKAGYKRDKYGWKYYRGSNTSEGKREIVHTFSDPLALPFKYFWRIHDAFRPGPRTAVDNLIRSFRYEVHPFIAPWIFDLRENRTPDGKMIYSMVDNGNIKTLKSVKYLMRRYIRLYDTIVPSKETKERRKLMNKEFGRVMSVMLSASVFSYVRKTKGERAAGRLKAVERRVMKEMMETKEPYSIEQMKNLNKMINDMMKEGDL